MAEDEEPPVIRSPQRAAMRASQYSYSAVSYDDDASRFQGFPAVDSNPSSPSKAAARYSPQKMNNTLIDSVHNSPLPRNRYQANLQESPRRMNHALIDVESNDGESLYDIYTNSPTKPGPLFQRLTSNETEYTYDSRKISGESTVYSGDTFGETKFELNHPKTQTYKKRGLSEVRRHPPAFKQRRILKLDNPIPSGLRDIIQKEILRNLPK